MSPAAGSRKTSFYAGRVPSADIPTALNGEYNGELDDGSIAVAPDDRLRRNPVVAASGSILNHLKLLKALFTYAFDNEHITTNPMARIKYSAGDRKERDDFTPEERKLILLLARKAEPHIYWVNWVCSFLGTRTSEVADASTLDIECIDGIWVMSIHRKHRSRVSGSRPRYRHASSRCTGRCSMRVFLIIGDHYCGARRCSPTCRSTPMASEPAR